MSAKTKKKTKTLVCSMNEICVCVCVRESGDTSEDISALMVGPTLVFMLICFSSSAHIVRHLRRVSGSFWGGKKDLFVSFFKSP